MCSDFSSRPTPRIRAVLGSHQYHGSRSDSEASVCVCVFFERGGFVKGDLMIVMAIFNFIKRVEATP